MFLLRCHYKKSKNMRTRFLESYNIPQFELTFFFMMGDGIHVSAHECTAAAQALSRSLHECHCHVACHAPILSLQ